MGLGVRYAGARLGARVKMPRRRFLLDAKSGAFLDRDGRRLDEVVGRVVGIILVEEPRGFGGEEVFLQGHSSGSSNASDNSEVGGVGDSAQTSLLGEPTSELWSHYLATVPEGQSRFSAERKAEIRAALKVRDLPTCRRAIDGLRVSPHHNGQNDTGTRYLDLKYAIGKAGRQSVGDRIDAMAAKAPAQTAGGLISVQALLARVPTSNRELVTSRMLEVKRWCDDTEPDDGLVQRADAAARWLAQHIKVEPVRLDDGSLKGWRQL